MPYTLSMGLLWFGLALVLGLVIGVALRSVTARREIANARSGAADRAELERLRARVTELEATAARPEVVTGGGPTASAAEPPVDPPAQRATSGDDFALAEVQIDDLTVVEGLGPGVRDLCHGIGISTWADLAETETSLLRTMLDDAGPRFRSHDPSTWPQQARLLNERRWDEFRALADDVRTAPASDPESGPAT